jgi:hypothetical protein
MKSVHQNPFSYILHSHIFKHFLRTSYYPGQKTTVRDRYIYIFFPLLVKVKRAIKRGYSWELRYELRGGSLRISYFKIY